jgi:elongation factor 4
LFIKVIYFIEIWIFYSIFIQNMMRLLKPLKLTIRLYSTTTCTGTTTNATITTGTTGAVTITTGTTTNASITTGTTTNATIPTGTNITNSNGTTITNSTGTNATTNRTILDVLNDIPPERIRNFSIIAHIDHGKSTLADRLLELAGNIKTTKNNQQILDSLKVERERGITVKAQTASMIYNYNGINYLLNLIDTPGHADFSYEVSRSLAACQGTLLLVDAVQGIQAQTIANFYLAFGQDLNIIPVINKVDLPSADIDKVKSQIENAFELDTSMIDCISAKSGIGVQNIFNTVVEKINSPQSNMNAPFCALLFDTWYDKYCGVICLLAIKDGSIKRGDKLVSGHTKQVYEIADLGILTPSKLSTEKLSAGQVGYVSMNLKTTRDANIGDTFYKQGYPTELFQGFSPAKSMVFAGLYPMDSSKFNELSEALDKLVLNDASVSVKKETSTSLGQGFRLGFLGTLHMDVFRQRLEEEYSTVVINTMPTVPYIIEYVNGTTCEIKSPAEFPDSNKRDVKHFLEPMVHGTFVFPDNYLGKIIELCCVIIQLNQNHRGEQLDCIYIDDSRVMLKYKLPMSEILTQFYDSLKSLTSGYCSFEYEEAGFEPSDLVRVNILLNQKPIDALSCICHSSHAESVAKVWVTKLKNVIERQLFEVTIQGQINGKFVARETIKAARKDVTAKCYGGDITRKMKLLNKQKESKKRMKKVGGVELSQEAFLTLMTGKK